MSVSWTNGDAAKRIVIINTSNSFTNPTDGTDPTANAAYGGSGEQVVFNNSGGSVTVTGLTAGTTYWFRAYEYNGTGASTLYLTSTATNNPNSQATASAATPVITLAGTLTSFPNTVANSTSAEQNYSVSGSNLTANIVITPPTGFQISTGTGGSFSATNLITLVQSGGNVSSTPIYVRFAPSAAGAYSGNITHTSTGATQQNQAVTGTGIKAEPTNHPTVFAAAAGTPAYSSINVSWTDATGGTVPDSYLIKASATSYAAIAAPADGTPEANGSLVKNVTQGTGAATFTGLDGSTTYYFKIFPYTNSGADINYKTDSPPEATATTTAAPALPKVFISEYIEGSSNNKAIEIYNGESTAIDLTKLTVRTYFNGGTSFGQSWTGSSGTLASGASIILYNSSAIAAITSVGTVITAVATFNGDDAIEVVYDGQVTDIFGIIGNDPGTAWDVAGVTGATADRTLLRKLNIVQGTTNWVTSAGTDASSSQWVVKANDYTGNLGEFGTGWEGTTDSDWATAANWDMGLPSGTVNVVVADVTNDPVISTTAACKNLFITSNGTPVLTVGSAGSLTVEDNLANKEGATGLLLESTSSGTGSLKHNTAEVPAMVKRYISGSSQAWHLLSSPVASQAIDPAFTTPTTTEYDFYAWHEPTITWINFKNTSVSPTWNEAIGSTNFVPGKGYLVEYLETNPTKTFAGNLNNGAVAPSLTVSGSGAYAQYNLVGNPYPSAIDWKAALGWDRSNLVASGDGYDMIIWNDAVGQYGSFNSAGSSGTNGVTQYIPVGQGFMVKAVSAGTLGMDNGIREHHSQAWLKSANAAENTLRLQVTSTVTPYSDEIVVEFGHATDAGGAEKMYSFYETAPSLFTVKPAGNFAVDFRGAAGPVTIPVSLKAGADGNYTLTASRLETFTATTAIMLEDLKTNITSNLSANPAYTFTAGKTDMSERFLLHFGGTFGTGEKGKQEPVTVYSSGSEVYILSTSGSSLKGEATVYDMLGRRVTALPLSEHALTKINFSGYSGYYLVRVITGNSTSTMKVFINK